MIVRCVRERAAEPRKVRKDRRTTFVVLDLLGIANASRKPDVGDDGVAAVDVSGIALGQQIIVDRPQESERAKEVRSIGFLMRGDMFSQIIKAGDAAEFLAA